MKSVIYFVSHGQEMGKKSSHITDIQILAPVRASQLLNLTSFNLISKLLLEHARDKKDLTHVIKWLDADIPTTEIIPKGTRITDIILSSAFDDKIMSGLMLIPDFKIPIFLHDGGTGFQELYGKYIHIPFLPTPDILFKIYINEKGIRKSIDAWFKTRDIEGASAYSASSGKVADGTLIYIVLTSPADVRASKILEPISTMHILVTSDREGHDYKIEHIVPNDPRKIKEYIERYHKLYEEEIQNWHAPLYPPPRDGLQVYDFTIPQDDLTLVLGCCRGEEDSQCVMS